MDVTSCPQCGALAEVLWRDVAASTDGPVELAKIQCVDRHWFLLPVASLPSASQAPAYQPSDAGAPRGRNSGAARPRTGATPL